MADPDGPSPRLRRALWAAAAFLIAFMALIVFIANYYLVPALSAAKDADVASKRQLSAFSTLLLAIVLFMLLVGLMITFRVRRFFFPGQPAAKTQTPFVDAWAESAKRLNVPARNEEDDDWDDLS